MGESQNSDWISQWQALARPYLSTWQDLAQANVPPPAPPSSPLQDGFEQWSRLFVSGGKQNETVERVLESVKGYAAFMQSALGALASSPNPGAAPWSDVLRQVMPGVTVRMFEHPAAQAWRDMAGGQGENGFKQVFAALDALRTPLPDGNPLETMLKMPAFGLRREHQEHSQKTMLAWLEYKQQMDRYIQLMLDAAQRGFAHFESKLAEREQPGRQIDSLRGIYDLWVDAAEEGYAEVALSPQFRDVYGALVNAQMRVRANIQQDVEKLSVDLGMPTRSEVNSLGERLQALRRDVRARGDSDSLKEELASLRAEFAAFKAEVRRTAAKVATAPAEESGKPAAKASAPRSRTAAPAKASAKKTATKTAKATGKGSSDEPADFAARIEKYARTSLGAARKTQARASVKPAKSAQSKAVAKTTGRRTPKGDA